MSLNPLLGGGDPAVRDVGHLLYRGLLKLDDRTAYPRPDLATSYTFSADGLTLSAVLPSTLRWSDGHPLTTTDVVATLAFAQSQRAANHSLTAQLHGVTVSVNNGSITFHLPAPRASFAATLAQLPILPLGGLSAGRLASVAAQSDAPLATSGPFQVQSADVNAVSLTRNAFAQHPPRLASFQLRLYSGFSDVLNAYKGGQVDGALALTPAQRTQLLAVKGSTSHDIATFRFVDLLFNERTPGLDDTVVRHALSTAVNRARIVDGALERVGGLPQVDAVPLGVQWAARPDLEAASPDAAATALEGAGWIFGPAGVREKHGVVLAFTIAVPDADPLPTVAKELATQLAVVGANVYVDVVPALTYVNTTLVPHNFQLALADWDAGPDPDVSSFWRSNAVPPQGFNVSEGPVDPFLDQALDSLATLVDPQARITAAQSVSRYLADDAPAAFLYTPRVSYVMRVAMSSAPVPAVGGSETRFDDVASWRRA